MLLILLSLIAGFLVSAISMAVLVRAGRRAGMLDTAGSSGHEKALRPVPNRNVAWLCNMHPGLMKPMKALNRQ